MVKKAVHPTDNNYDIDTHYQVHNVHHIVHMEKHIHFVPHCDHNTTSVLSCDMNQKSDGQEHHQNFATKTALRDKREKEIREREKEKERKKEKRR